MAGIGLLLALVGASSRVVAFAPGLLLIGLGLGVMLTPSVNVVQSSFPEELQGEISGLSRSVSNLGSSFGTAIAGTILVSDLASGNTSYVLAMVALAVLALIGLAAAAPSAQPRTARERERPHRATRDRERDRARLTHRASGITRGHKRKPLRAISSILSSTATTSVTVCASAAKASDRASSAPSAATREACSCCKRSTAAIVAGSRGSEVMPNASGTPTATAPSPGSQTVTTRPDGRQTGRRPPGPPCARASERSYAFATGESPGMFNRDHRRAVEARLEATTWYIRAHRADNETGGAHAATNRRHAGPHDRIRGRR